MWFTDSLIFSIENLGYGVNERDYLTVWSQSYLFPKTYKKDLKSISTEYEIF